MTIFSTQHFKSALASQGANLSIAEFQDVAEELTFWQEKRQDVQSQLKAVQPQQFRENFGFFSRRVSSFPTSLEMIVSSLEGELAMIDERIQNLTIASGN